MDLRMSQPAQAFFSDPQFKADPYPVYAQLRRGAPVQRTRLANGVQVYLVTRYADVQAGLRDARLIKNIHNAREPGLLDRLGHLFGVDLNNTSMLRADPPEHTRLRALAHAAFTPKYVSQMRGHIQHIADDLLDAVQAGGRMDLISDFALPLPITVICEMLGVPTADNRKFRQWSWALITSGILSRERPRPVPALLVLVRYMRRLVAERRRTPQDDLISKLIHVEAGGDRFTDAELIGTSLVLLIAGHETTANLIGSGALALLQNPAQLETLKDDPSLIKVAVEELLRYVNPVQYVNRYAAEELEISGVRIPKGSHLALVLAGANHDPDFTADPERLDVRQGDTRHVAFGQGIHYCLGAPLARLEGEIAFSTLLKRLPNLRLDVAQQALEWRASYELRGLSVLRVTF
jgi:cytochrome P450